MIHKDKKVERSLKIIKRARYTRENMPQENEKVMRQLHSDLTMMKTKIHNNSINKVIDFCLEKGQMNNDAENLYVITEA